MLPLYSRCHMLILQRKEKKKHKYKQNKNVKDRTTPRRIDNYMFSHNRLRNELFIHRRHFF